MKKPARKESNTPHAESKKRNQLPLEADHKKRFDQLLDDAVLGVKKKPAD